MEYNSYNPQDDDWYGYEYSIKGSLSAVRIVILYRFIQEVGGWVDGWVGDKWSGKCTIARSRPIPVAHGRTAGCAFGCAEKRPPSGLMGLLEH